MARAGRASRRRAPEGRPRAHRSRGARADEEAGDRRLRGVRPARSRAPRAQAGKKQYLVPYFIASHPGSDLDAMIDLALFLKRNGYQPDQVQDFIPAPVRHRHVHVLHGPRPVHRPSRSYVARTASASGDCSGPCCSSSSRRTTSTCARRWSRPAARPDRRRRGLPHPVASAENRGEPPSTSTTSRCRD